MPIYHSLGKIPAKRHTQFRNAKGGLYFEQLFGTEGFHGMSSLLYHIHRPTQITTIGESKPIFPKAAVTHNIEPRKLWTWRTRPGIDFLDSRTPLLFNQNLIIGTAAYDGSAMEYFYKNADADEMIFIHHGAGVLHSFFGTIEFQAGDYLIIPRGVIYQIEWKLGDHRILYAESQQPIYFPRRYRNEFGQLLEHAPFCERDILRPQYAEPKDETGEFPIKIKKQGILHTLLYRSHPFDVVGWDGYNYPYAFSIHNFEPITGRVHQPPPVHQTFQSQHFVVCSFCPRLYDYHPQAIPAPYHHSNIDSDEVIYYVDGDFMSRNDVAQGMITLHPGGIPHGPQPGAIERSIGAKETNELAVMIDPFQPLQITEQALTIMDEQYAYSWLGD